MPDFLYGNRYFGREAGWHKLGHVIGNRDVSALEAMEIAQLRYVTEKMPLSITLPDGSLMRTNNYALTRLPTVDDPIHRVFDIVTEDYVILSNEAVFAALDPISQLWPVETAGAIEYGARAFMSLKAGNFGVTAKNGQKDEIELYYLVVNSFTGATVISFTPIRVVCKNTLTLAGSNYTVKANVRHKGQAMLEYSAMLALVAKLNNVKETALDVFNLMAQTTIEKTDVMQIINAAYPLPKKGQKLSMINSVDVNGEDGPNDSSDPFKAILQSAADRHEYNTGRAQKHQNELYRLYDWYNDNHSAYANTAWNAYNAVTDYIDHVQSGGNRDVSAVFGTRAAQKSKAFEMAVSLIS